MWGGGGGVRRGGRVATLLSYLFYSSIHRCLSPIARSDEAPRSSTRSNTQSTYILGFNRAGETQEASFIKVRARTCKMSVDGLLVARIWNYLVRGAGQRVSLRLAGLPGLRGTFLLRVSRLP